MCGKTGPTINQKRVQNRVRKSASFAMPSQSVATTKRWDANGDTTNRNFSIGTAKSLRRDRAPFGPYFPGDAVRSPSPPASNTMPP
ncbi:hypothetical protein Trydic_g23788 [Trypoxylus dichotomus]